MNEIDDQGTGVGEEEVNHMQNFINSIIDQDFNNANTSFEEILAMKQVDILDQEKIRLANAVYNNPEEDAEDEEMADEEIEDEDLAEVDDYQAEEPQEPREDN